MPTLILCYLSSSNLRLTLNLLNTIAFSLSDSTLLIACSYFYEVPNCSNAEAKRLSICAENTACNPGLPELSSFSVGSENNTLSDYEDCSDTVDDSIMTLNLSKILNTDEQAARSHRRDSSDDGNDISQLSKDSQRVKSLRSKLVAQLASANPLKLTNKLSSFSKRFGSLQRTNAQSQSDYDETQPQATQKQDNQDTHTKSHSVEDTLATIRESRDEAPDQRDHKQAASRRVMRRGDEIDLSNEESESRHVAGAFSVESDGDMSSHSHASNETLCTVKDAINIDAQPGATSTRSSMSNSSISQSNNTSAEQATIKPLKTAQESSTASSRDIASDSTSSHRARVGSASAIVRSASARAQPSRSQTPHMLQTSASAEPNTGFDQLEVQRTNDQSSSDFVSSVKIIRAQQHLLQNMIRLQNQNLVTHSMDKYKTMQYPHRVYENEYPFVTLKRLPKNMIRCTGGVVSVHSVKLLDHIINDEESETRDLWWTEIRKEIRSHAKSLNCNTILGYSEVSKTLGDVCILSAIGTAAVMKSVEDIRCEAEYCRSTNHQTLSVPQSCESPLRAKSYMPSETGSTQQRSPTDCSVASNSDRFSKFSKSISIESIDCSFCHTPLTCASTTATLATCAICKSEKVPDILLLTIEPPDNMPAINLGTLVQARVCRAKRDLHGDACAKEIAESLPFLEYELHKQLYSKLKFKGLNCLYNLTIDISVGENMLTGIATATGCFILGLPIPDPPTISASKGIKTSKLSEIQRLIAKAAEKNREDLGINEIESILSEFHARLRIEVPEMQVDDDNSRARFHIASKDAASPASSNHQIAPESEHNYSSSNRRLKHGKSNGKHRRHHHDAHHASKSHKHRDHHTHENVDRNDENNIVLEVDDNEDADIIALLIDSDVPKGYTICNSETVPSMHQSEIYSINMFTQVTRAKLAAMDQFALQFERVLQALYVKLRRSLPCFLSNLNFVVDLPEAHVVQISVTGCLLGLRDTRPESRVGSNQARSVDNATIRQRKNSKSRLITTSASAPSMSHVSSTSTSSSTSPGDRSSSTTSASPTNPGALKSSSSSASMKSIVDTSPVHDGGPSVAQQKPEPSTSGIRSSLTKQFSKSNITALLTRKASVATHAKPSTSDGIELDAQNSNNNNATIAAVKQEIQQTRFDQGWQAAKFDDDATNISEKRRIRTVFKKQQTYPGANSPAISGQDCLLEPDAQVENKPADHQTPTTRRAASILNKVKQPLRERLTSNASNAAARDANGESASLTPKSQKARIITKKITRGSQNINISTEAPVQGPSTSLSVRPPGSIGINVAADSSTGKQSINSSIDITSLSYIPGANEYCYLGNLSFSFVRETSSVRENGGLNGFIHCFLMEVYAIVRAHVSALSGNALLSFRLQQSCIFYHPNKNQAQCLISVTGDAVQVSRS